MSSYILTCITYLSQKLLSIFLEGLAGCGELAVNAFQSPAQDDDESTISNLKFNEGLPEIKLQLEELTRRVLCTKTLPAIPSQSVRLST